MTDQEKYESIARQQAIKHFIGYMSLHHQSNKNPLSGFYSLRSLIKRLLKDSIEITTTASNNQVSFTVTSITPLRVEMTSYRLF